MSELADAIMNAIGTVWPLMLTGAIIALAAALASSTSPLSFRRERRHEARQREADEARKRIV